MRYVGNKDVNLAVEGLVELGWRVTQSATHVVVKHPTDRTQKVTLSRGTGNSHGYEAVKRIRSILKRARAVAAKPLGA